MDNNRLYIEEFRNNLAKKYGYDSLRPKQKKLLDLVLDDITPELYRLYVEQQELLYAGDILRGMMPHCFHKDQNGISRIHPSFSLTDRSYLFYAWIDPADAAGGDFFDFVQLDESSIAISKGDVAGHGITAAIMASANQFLVRDHLRQIRDHRHAGNNPETNFSSLQGRLNDTWNDIGLWGRFTANQLVEISLDNGSYRVRHAGDKRIDHWNAREKRLDLIEMPQTPAHGQFETKTINLMMESKKESGHPVEPQGEGILEPGDMLIMHTDGIEESHRKFRDADLNPVDYWDFTDEILQKDLSENYHLLPEYEQREIGIPKETMPLVESLQWGDVISETKKNRNKTTKKRRWLSDLPLEQFNSTRLYSLITAALNGSIWELRFRCDVAGHGPLHFDFTGMTPTPENLVLAVVSVERVFRLLPDRSAGPDDQISIDAAQEAFLREHYREFDIWFHSRVTPDSVKEGPVIYSYLREDPQDDDLAILVYQHLSNRDIRSRNTEARNDESASAYQQDEDPEESGELEEP